MKSDLLQREYDCFPKCVLPLVGVNLITYLIMLELVSCNMNTHRQTAPATSIVGNVCLDVILYRRLMASIVRELCLEIDIILDVYG